MNYHIIIIIIIIISSPLGRTITTTCPVRDALVNYGRGTCPPLHRTTDAGGQVSKRRRWWTRPHHVNHLPITQKQALVSPEPPLEIKRISLNARCKKINDYDNFIAPEGRGEQYTDA